MPGQHFKVGIIGLKPGRGWAVRAHIPAHFGIFIAVDQNGGRDNARLRVVWL
jgi:hypothetical protein